MIKVWQVTSHGYFHGTLQYSFLMQDTENTEQREHDYTTRGRVGKPAMVTRDHVTVNDHKPLLLLSYFEVASTGDQL